MTTSASIVGFNDPRADLHRKSPRIFASSAFVTVLVMAIGLNAPLIQKQSMEKKVKTPPAIIQLENIPETHQRVTVSAPKLSVPLEVSNDEMIDDVTIENTSLDMNAPVSSDVKPVIVPEKIVQEQHVEEEESFEFFAVEEQPERMSEVIPDYPESARSLGIHGTVFVRALVGKDGSVEKAEIMKGPDMLKEAAVEAAMKTKFKPAKQNDMPVKCWVQMKFTFELE